MCGMRYAGYMLYRAVASADLGEVQNILTSTPQAVEYETNNGESCLHAACQFHVENYTAHEQAIPRLVSAGCSINKRSHDGTTALMAACYYGHAACVEQLIKLGADVNVKVYPLEPIHPLGTHSTKVRPPRLRSTALTRDFAVDARLCAEREWVDRSRLCD